MWIWANYSDWLLSARQRVLRQLEKKKKWKHTFVAWTDYWSSTRWIGRPWLKSPNTRMVLAHTWDLFVWRKSWVGQRRAQIMRHRRLARSLRHSVARRKLSLVTSKMSRQVKAKVQQKNVGNQWKRRDSWLARMPCRHKPEELMEVQTSGVVANGKLGRSVVLSRPLMKILLIGGCSEDKQAAGMALVSKLFFLCCHRNNSRFITSVKNLGNIGLVLFSSICSLHSAIFPSHNAYHPWETSISWPSYHTTIFFLFGSCSSSEFLLPSIPLPNKCFSCSSSSTMLPSYSHLIACKKLLPHHLYTIYSRRQCQKHASKTRYGYGLQFFSTYKFQRGNLISCSPFSTFVN